MISPQVWASKLSLDANPKLPFENFDSFLLEFFKIKSFVFEI